MTTALTREDVLKLFPTGLLPVRLVLLERLGELAKPEMYARMPADMAFRTLLGELNLIVGELHRDVQTAAHERPQDMLDVFYDRLTKLRAQLQDSIDPDEIGHLCQQVVTFVNLALQCATEDADNRSRLIQIVDDANKLATERFEVAVEVISRRLEQAPA
ncbi:MAG TPA: hypothetical protein VK504_16785 [Vicinamibacterales bacterium]|nr:hypothetical protein [Vicinamibacterales bacterium]